MDLAHPMLCYYKVQKTNDKSVTAYRFDITFPWEGQVCDCDCNKETIAFAQSAWESSCTLSSSSSSFVFLFLVWKLYLLFYSMFWNLILLKDVGLIKDKCYVHNIFTLLSQQIISGKLFWIVIGR